jgi:hypothetical protein
MVKSTVKVAVRTRPTASFAHSELVVHPEARSIDVNVKKNPSMGVVNNMRENYTFKFDTILHNSSQDTVYNECVSEIVNKCVSDLNSIQPHDAACPPSSLPPPDFFPPLSFCCVSSTATAPESEASANEDSSSNLHPRRP